MTQVQSDEEQIAMLKQWWNLYGIPVLTIVVIAVAGYFGFKAWKNQQDQYNSEASVLFSELLEAVAEEQGSELTSEENKTTADYLFKQLQDDYAKSSYAVMASMIAAKLAVNRSNYDEALEYLTFSEERSPSQLLPLIRLRLARLHFIRDELDAAMSYTSYDHNDHLSYLYSDLKGDIFKAKGDLVAAKDAYLAGKKSLEDLEYTQGSEQQKRFFELKLSELNEAANPS